MQKGIDNSVMPLAIWLMFPRGLALTGNLAAVMKRP
jgi:hypothetical protein